MSAQVTRRYGTVVTRRVRILAALLVGALGAGVAHARTDQIGGAAVAGSEAERVLVPSDGLLFPIFPSPRCEVFNNFGGYSKTYGAGGHEGVDIGAMQGQEVYAVEGGVLYRQWTSLSGSAGLGWGLLGDSGTAYRYFHLAGFAPGLAVGTRVAAGQLIGFVGDTGNATPGGWHLHFEVRPGPQPQYGAATPVDPVPLLDIPAVCNVY
jgi:murein DD-endopeptidase MepM/ murein hydrolase activator NlpD